MKKILNYIIVGILVTFAYSCEEDLPSGSTNYVSFEADPIATVGVGEGSTSTDIKVYTGNVTGSSRTFDIIVDLGASTADPAGYSVPSSVVIPGGTNEGSFTLQLNEDALTFGGGTVVVMFASTAETFTSDPVSISVSLQCPNALSTVSFAFDGYASEIDWTITDSNSSVVLSGGGYSDGLASLAVSACLFEGETYTWTIDDSFGDGLSYPDDGSASISFNGTVLSTVTGNFGSQFVDTFTVN